MAVKVKDKPKRDPWRPPMYKDPFKLQEKIEEYFEKGVKKREVIVGRGENSTIIEVPVPTITGLVRYCGFADRHSFYEYEKKPNFSHTIKTARALMEQIYEEGLHSSNVVGSIFALKNFGWTDKLAIGEDADQPFKNLKVQFVNNKGEAVDPDS